MTYQIIITFKILQFFTSCLTKLAKYFLSSGLQIDAHKD